MVNGIFISVKKNLVFRKKKNCICCTIVGNPVLSYMWVEAPFSDIVLNLRKNYIKK
jgi:hypothetical protein